jgi:hypothetical protein
VRIARYTTGDGAAFGVVEGDLVNGEPTRGETASTG